MSALRLNGQPVNAPSATNVILQDTSADDGGSAPVNGVVLQPVTRSHTEPFTMITHEDVRAPERSTQKMGNYDYISDL